jgi:hypothetical protein
MKMFARRIANALLLAVLATALPQIADEASSLVSATNPIANLPGVSTSTGTARSATSLASETLSTTGTATGTGFVSATNTRASPLPTGLNATFVGWSSSSRRSGTTRYASLYCSRSSIYITSVASDGITYAGCCSASNLANCATRTLAHYCVNNVQMAGNQTVSDCGTSTCAHAFVYQNVGDEDRGIAPISFAHCAYYGSRGGTVYRTLPASNAITRPFWATSTSSSSSSRDDDDGRPQRMGAAIGGAIVAFLVIFVILPLCILKRVRKGRVNGGAAAGGAGRGRYQAAPPGVTVPEPAPPYQRGGGGEASVGQAYTTLDPGRGGAVSWFAMGSAGADQSATAPKPNEEMQDAPPRYEDVRRDRIVR